MIAFVQGILEMTGEESIVVENHGIGYEILVPGSVLSALPQTGNEVKIYTYTHVREDALQLFGFLTRESMNMFKMLITVNGVGPKGALGILTVFDTDSLHLAILSDDAKAIAKSPGIGAKTASKIILELKDKLKLDERIEEKLLGDVQDTENPDVSLMDDVVQALVALGYSSSQAVSAVKKVQKEGMSVEELLKQSLKNIM